MTSLIERYVSAATDSVPEGQRAEIRAEIRAAIDEMVDRRIENGEPASASVGAALEELGDPRDLARQYNDAPQYLIGPGWYPLYIEVLKRVVPIALVAIAVISMVVNVAEGDSGLISILLDAAGSAVWGALQFFFWTTLGFVIAERTTGEAPSFSRKERWTVEDLPKLTTPRQIGLGETIGTVLTLVVLGVLLIVQQVRGVGALLFGDIDGDWEGLPLISPDLGPGWTAGFAIIVAVSVAVALAGYLERSYTLRIVVLTAIENVLWVAYIVALAASEPIFNPEFARRISDSGGEWWAAGGQANRIAAIVIIAYSAWDIWDAWSRYRGNRSVSEMASMAA
jgi:hypothetical protein